MLIIQSAQHPLFQRWLKLKFDQPQLRRSEAARRLGVRDIELAMSDPQACLLHCTLATFAQGIIALGPMSILSESWGIEASTMATLERVERTPESITLIPSGDTDVFRWTITPEECLAIVAAQEHTDSGIRRWFQIYGHSGQGLLRFVPHNLSKYDWIALLHEWRDPEQHWPLHFSTQIRQPQRQPRFSLEVRQTLGDLHQLCKPGQRISMNWKREALEFTYSGVVNASKTINDALVISGNALHTCLGLVHMQHKVGNGQALRIQMAPSGQHQEAECITLSTEPLTGRLDSFVTTNI